jgi:hypothetical protein
MGAPALEDVVPTVEMPADGEQVLVLLKKDPITDYPWWARWLLYAVYWLTNYDGGIQLVTASRTEAEAERFAKDAGHRGVWLVMNKPLPDERCQWKPAVHFKSPLKSRYLNYEPELLAVEAEKVQSLRQIVKTLQAL